MLFPVTKEYEDMRKTQDDHILKDGVEGVEDVIYFKQTSRVALSPLPAHIVGAATDQPFLARSRQRLRHLCAPAHARQHGRAHQCVEPVLAPSASLALGRSRARGLAFSRTALTQLCVPCRGGSPD